MFSTPPPLPSNLPPDLAAAALLADRAERLLTSFFDSHPDEKPELVIKASRAIWSLTAVRKTIYLLVNPGADRRHKRKPDATMTYIEHRVQELHDWVSEYHRLVFALKKGAQFVVTPSGGSPDNTSSSPGAPVSAPAPSPTPSPSAPLRLRVENSSTPAVSPSAPSAPPQPLCDRSTTPEQPYTPLPAHMTTTPPLRNPLGTALGAARATVAIATEANIPFDPINFFPAEIDPAAAIAEAHARQENTSSKSSSSYSSSSLVPPGLGGEKVTFRNRQVTLTGKPMPPNDLPQLPKLLNPRPSVQSENPRPLLSPGAAATLRPPPP